MCGLQANMEKALDLDLSALQDLHVIMSPRDSDTHGTKEVMVRIRMIVDPAVRSSSCVL